MYFLQLFPLSVWFFVPTLHCRGKRFGPFLAQELAQKLKEKRCKIVWSTILQRFFGGKRGIRTPGPSQVNGFQDRRIRPLCHLSGWLCCLCGDKGYRIEFAKIHIFLWLARKKIASSCKCVGRAQWKPEVFAHICQEEDYAFQLLLLLSLGAV